MTQGCATVSPDGTKIAVDVIHPGDDYGDIAPNLTADAIIDTTTGKTTTIPVNGTVTQIPFRSDGTTLVRSTRQGVTTLTLLATDGSVQATVAEPVAAKNWRLTGYRRR